MPGYGRVLIRSANYEITPAIDEQFKWMDNTLDQNMKEKIGFCDGCHT